MKKEKSNLLVISCIIFLSLFIFLPPIFRSFIPKIEEDNNKKTDKLEVLLCTKISNTEMLKITSRCKYKNGKFESNTVKIEKLLELSTEPIQDSNVTIATENINLASINGIVSTVSENFTEYKIDTLLIKNNLNNEILKHYIQDLETQKNTYESILYNCSIMES